MDADHVLVLYRVSRRNRQGDTFKMDGEHVLPGSHTKSTRHGTQSVHTKHDLLF